MANGITALEGSPFENDDPSKWNVPAGESMFYNPATEQLETAKSKGELGAGWVKVYTPGASAAAPTASGGASGGIPAQGTGSPETGLTPVDIAGSVDPTTGAVTATTGTATATSPDSTTDGDALADVTSILDQYGLGDLSNWAWGELTAGKTEAQVVLDLYNTPEFENRFPAIAQRQEAGLPPISPADYINYEDSATQILKAAGFPSTTWSDPTLITSLIGGDTSLSELQTRAGLAAQAVFQSPKAVQDAFQRDFGVSAGSLAAYFVDPQTALPALQQEFLAAQIGGAGTLAGYGTNPGIDTRLAADGISAQAATAGFQDLGSKEQLFTPLPGEQGTALSQDQQVAAEFEGNAQDQALINQVAARRKAQFAGSGGFGASQQGYTGLGVAQ